MAAIILPVPGIPIEQQPAPVLLRLCLWGEARGESAIGKLAIAWVIKNRAAKGNYAACDAVAALLIGGWTTDPSLGSTHYYNPAVASPPWGRGSPWWQERATIGNHCFGLAP